MDLILTLFYLNMQLTPVEKYFVPNNILDIGANVGQFFSLAKTQWPNSNIFSIEGNPFCEKQLSKLNKQYKICLLHSKKELIDFYINKYDILSTGCSIYKEISRYFNFDSTKCVKLRTTTLDYLFPYQSFDLIKLDTQGSELEILKGGKLILQRSKGIIIEVSHKPYNLNAPLSFSVVEYMLKNNFLLKETLCTNQQCCQSDYLFINEWWLNVYKKFMDQNLSVPFLKRNLDE